MDMTMMFISRGKRKEICKGSDMYLFIFGFPNVVKVNEIKNVKDKDGKNVETTEEKSVKPN